MLDMGAGCCYCCDRQHKGIHFTGSPPYSSVVISSQKGRQCEICQPPGPGIPITHTLSLPIAASSLWKQQTTKKIPRINLSVQRREYVTWVSRPETFRIVFSKPCRKKFGISSSLLTVGVVCCKFPRFPLCGNFPSAPDTGRNPRFVFSSFDVDPGATSHYGERYIYAFSAKLSFYFTAGEKVLNLDILLQEKLSFLQAGARNINLNLCVLQAKEKACPVLPSCLMLLPALLIQFFHSAPDLWPFPAIDEGHKFPGHCIVIATSNSQQGPPAPLINF